MISSRYNISLLSSIAVFLLSLLFLYSFAAMPMYIITYAQTPSTPFKKLFWTADASTPTTRTEEAAVTIVGDNNNIYFIRGFDKSDHATDIVEVYSIGNNNILTRVTPLPQSLYHSMDIAYNGKLQVVNGYTDSWFLSEELFIYYLKEYNSDTNNMHNNTTTTTTDEDVSKEGSSSSFKSKKGIEGYPSNESQEVVKDIDKIEDIPIGVPVEPKKFRELKDQANETINTDKEQATIQENNVVQEDR
jgi:hypothetical protein